MALLDAAWQSGILQENLPSGPWEWDLLTAAQMNRQEDGQNLYHYRYFAVK